MKKTLPKVETKPRKGIELEEVAELEEPIKKIIEKIKSRIENGDYGLIIGDDASGRVPVLILGNFIRKVSEKRDLNKPNIIFIPGKLRSYFFDNESKKKYFDRHISKFGVTKDKRILIVTDTVLSGLSLEVLIGLLHDMGYVCDIATIGVETSETNASLRDVMLDGSEVVSGEYFNEYSSTI